MSYVMTDKLLHNSLYRVEFTFNGLYLSILHTVCIRYTHVRVIFIGFSKSHCSSISTHSVATGGGGGGGFLKPTQAQYAMVESSYSSTSPPRQTQICTAWLLMDDCVTAAFCLAELVDK